MAREHPTWVRELATDRIADVTVIATGEARYNDNQEPVVLPRGGEGWVHAEEDSA